MKKFYYRCFFMATLQATTAQNRTEPVTITDMFKIKPLEYNAN
jgi:hypothetical protein